MASGPPSGAKKEQWGTRVGLVLAVAGNAVGLGNFLRFPAQAAQNGGGAFLVPYLISFVLMGLPLLWVEWAIGRHGGQYGHHSAPGMFARLGRSRWLKYVGVFGLFTNLTVAAYYCYIESWTLAYVWHSLRGTFTAVSPTTFFPEYLGTTQDDIAAIPWEATGFFLVTLALNVWLLSRGLVRGVELAAKIGMPLLLGFGAVLAIRGLLLGPGDPGVIESPLVGLNFVWEPQAAGLFNPSTWLAAAGQIFFTLSVGMGSIHCYAAYLRERDDIALNATTAGTVNEFVEVILGGSILIPIATAYLGLAAVQAATAGGSGFDLGFLTLPTLFNEWGWFGPVAGAMWFGLLFFAGITSSLAMGQPVLAFLQDEFKVRREWAALGFGLATLLLGALVVILYPGGSFGEFDFWTGTFSLIVFALAEVLIFGWIFGIDRGWAELNRGADLRLPGFYKYVIKYVTPLFILVVLVGAMVNPSGSWGEAVSQLFSTGSWPLAAESVLGKVLHVGETGGYFDATGKITPMFVKDLTRVVLLTVFSLIAVLVWKAFRGRNIEASTQRPDQSEGGAP
ncbi:sodium-dependent transporter [Nannocystis radixulma]|uniref:Sodium-dependent transporter n=1 Tax=Nannocystis radixulma TaxID=2995305 RepID=A0ABT5B0K7_9BACT|nr:sodium-dependent transporter [Nannocystis radixulma]MDC0667636.1 sodium-dependent transporter [Nannocystis radixulma]